MNDTTHAVGKPPIIVRNTDYARLIALAQASMERESVVGDELMAELERASVIGDESAMRQTIQMGSTATYTTENGEARTVILVYPGEANIEENRVSILTPIGVALLGLSKGQTINWVTRDGHIRVLSVTDVAG
ncbi:MULTISPECIES: nucleoside diphosphate kinase regulator [unclassified Rhizobium]|uniref:nucleoside diphosphate kinase regulator n=1 Tax=unclassified Rhizobium TaxID=2613769 RepID=UPI003824D2D7